jgi:hypothetical protein
LEGVENGLVVEDGLIAIVVEEKVESFAPISLPLKVHPTKFGSGKLPRSSKGFVKASTLGILIRCGGIQSGTRTSP